MPQSYYIETSIPSFYHDSRDDIQAQAMRKWTREWWNTINEENAFPVTWNCRNIANANKFGHIRRVNGMLGLFTPELVTPFLLLEDREYE